MKMPREIGPYQLIDKIGEGGMSVVYLAKHIKTGTKVALKTIRVINEFELDAIRQEIRALAAIKHPSIVTIIEEGIHEGLPWYAMDFLDGISLREQFCASRDEIRDRRRLKKRNKNNDTMVSVTDDYSRDGCGDLTGFHTSAGPMISPIPEKNKTVLESMPKNMPSSDAGYEQNARYYLDIFQQICVALAYIHGEGLVHRDLKPENILITAGNQPILVDFGIATWFRGKKGKDRLFLNKFAGTIQYMAPEQIQGEVVDARADLYALGCMLYEAMTGRSPFSGLTRTAVARAHIYSIPPKPSKFNRTIVPILDDLIMRLIAKKPEDRFGHAQTVAQTLATISGRPVSIIAPPPRPYLYRSRCAGRKESIDTLQQWLGFSGDNAVKLGLIEGESGIGKTRLLMEFGHSVETDYCILTGECTEHGGCAMGGFYTPLHMIFSLSRQDGYDDLKAVLKKEGPYIADLDPHLSFLNGSLSKKNSSPRMLNRERVFIALFRILAALSKQNPVLLLIDDLQIADEVTLDFLSYFCRLSEIEDFPITIVGAYRSDAQGYSQFHQPGWAGVKKLQLNRLRDHEILDTIRDMMAIQEIPRNLIATLVRHAEGNPFIVSEFLHAAIDEHLLYQDQFGNWRFEFAEQSDFSFQEQLEKLPLPETLRNLMGRRLRSLPSKTRELVNMMAVINIPSSFDFLRALLQWQDDHFLDIIHELQKKHIVIVNNERIVRFYYTKMAKIVYQAIPGEKRRRLHAIVSQRLRAMKEEEQTVYLSTIGFHFEQAGSVSDAQYWYLRAAKQALRNYAKNEAARLYECYFNVVTCPTTESISNRLEFATRVLFNIGHAEAAGTQLNTALMEAQEINEPRLMAQCFRSCGWFNSERGDTKEALSLYHKGLAITTKHNFRNIEGKIRGSIALLKQYQRHHQEARKFYLEAIACAQETNDERDEAVGLANMATLFQDENDYDKASEFLERALEMHQRLDNRHAENQTLMNIALIKQEQGNLEEAEQLLQKTLVYAHESGDIRSEQFFIGNIATLYIELKRFDKADKYYERCIRIATLLGDKRALATWYANRAYLNSELGNIEEARKQYQSSIAIATSLDDPLLCCSILNIYATLERKTNDSPETAISIIARAKKYALQSSIPAEIAYILCEQGHCELARGQSAQPQLKELTSLSTRLNQQESAELKEPIHALKAAQQAFENKEFEKLEHGELRADI